jgi:ribosomal protein S18 acetylase RimI-like enzyme
LRIPLKRLKKELSLRISMEFRRLTIDDYDRLTKLWEKSRLSFRPQGRDSREAIVAEMVANPDFFVGAFEGDRLIGVVVLSCDLRRGWINRLAVNPNCRRRGVAKALIAESERILRTRGVRLFCALVDDDNTASKELFRECGYVEHHDIIYFSKRDSEEV